MWVCPLQSFPFCNSNTCKRVTLFNHVWSYFLAITGAMPSFLIHRQLTFEFHNSRVQWTSVRFHWALCLSVDRFVSSLTTVKSFFLLQPISSFSTFLCYKLPLNVSFETLHVGRCILSAQLIKPKLSRSNKVCFLLYWRNSAIQESVFLLKMLESL